MLNESITLFFFVCWFEFADDIKMAQSITNEWEANRGGEKVQFFFQIF